MVSAYERELIENIKRNARHGRESFPLEDEYTSQIDTFQHIEDIADQLLREDEEGACERF